MRVNYKGPTKLTKKDKKRKRLAKEQNQKAQKNDADMEEDTAQNSKLTDASRAKRKQIFKKSKSKDIKS